MIRLLPNTDAQILSIIPREYTEASDLELVIMEDGTRKTETLENLTSVINGNFLDIECTFSILSEDSSYSIEVKHFPSEFPCPGKSKERTLKFWLDKYCSVSDQTI